MEIGYFTMPSHPPECGLKEGHDWDLQVLRWADELGYQEAWIGEHHTAPWEPHPAPDLLLAQAFLQTKNIRLGPGGFLLPYHHPPNSPTASRCSTISPKAGSISASRPPACRATGRCSTSTACRGQNRDMTREALEIILKMWSEDAPWTYNGKFWTVSKPDVMFDFLKPHIKPLQTPHPPIGGGRPQQGLRHAEAGRRARLHPDEPQPQSGLCVEPLGIGGDRRGQDRAHAEPAGLAHGARGVRGRHRRGSLALCRWAT